MPRRTGCWYVASYKRLKYHYFLIDFCYFVHLMAVLHVLLWPTNRRSFQVMFAAANGPIVFAILAWRNSLVFHSLDKTTSLLVHVFPPLVTYCMRWCVRRKSRGVGAGRVVGESRHALAT